MRIGYLLKLLKDKNYGRIAHTFYEFSFNRPLPKSFAKKICQILYQGLRES